MTPDLKALTPVIALVLSGCVAVGPQYEQPRLDVPVSFVGDASGELVDAAQLAWWRYLADPTLNDLVSTGLEQNLNIAEALERIVAARENAKRFGVAQQIDGGASASARRRELSDDSIVEEVSAGADATFVFDLFGEFRRGRERSLAELEASEFDAGTVKLAYLAEIVSSYILVRYFESAAAITRQSIASRRRTLGLVRQREVEEEGTALEVAQAQSLLRSAEARLPILEAQARVNAFRIATLLNVPAATVLAQLKGRSGIPTPSGGMATGVPADLLRNRPDIRAAERRLAAATAEVGVTEAQLYPSLRLSGNVTVGDNDGWSFGPSLNLPIFDQPARRATRNVAASEARRAEVVYRREVVEAIEEVQAALILVEARRREVGAYRNAVAASNQVRTLSRESFDEELITLDEVLDAERTQLDNQTQLAEALGEWAQAWVRLQVALGKGWGATGQTFLAASLK